jgi:hypothetical protein
VKAALDAAPRRVDAPAESKVVEPPAPVDPIPINPVPPTAAFASIDEVPELVIRTKALDVVSEFGATTADDLCSAISRRLGFKRLGAKIKARIDASIESLCLEGKLSRQGDGRLSRSVAATG